MILRPAPRSGVLQPPFVRATLDPAMWWLKHTTTPTKVQNQPQPVAACFSRRFFSRPARPVDVVAKAHHYVGKRFSPMPSGNSRHEYHRCTAFQSSPPFQGGDRTNRRSGDLCRGGSGRLGLTAQGGRMSPRAAQRQYPRNKPNQSPRQQTLSHLILPHSDELDTTRTFAAAGDSRPPPGFPQFLIYAMASCFGRRFFSRPARPVDVVAEAHHYVGNRS